MEFDGGRQESLSNATMEHQAALDDCQRQLLKRRLEHNTEHDSRPLTSESELIPTLPCLILALTIDESSGPSVHTVKITFLELKLIRNTVPYTCLYVS